MFRPVPSDDLVQTFLRACLVSIRCRRHIAVDKGVDKGVILKAELCGKLCGQIALLGLKQGTRMVSHEVAEPGIGLFHIA